VTVRNEQPALEVPQLLANAEHALELVTTADDAEVLWRKLKALEHVARMAKLSQELRLRGARLQLRAERRWGELLGSAENHGPATVTGGDGSRGADRMARSRAREVAGVPEPVFDHYVTTARDPESLSRAGLLREHKREATAREHRPPAAPPTGRFLTLVVDPPWPMQKIERHVRPNQVRPLDYPPMSADELRAFEVPAAPNAHLYLWTTHKFLPLALELVGTWGFDYQCVLTWVKNVGFTPFSWMYSTELCLFARRGSLDLLVKGRRLDVHAKVREHSRKPDEFYDLVRDVSPGPRIDMFSREPRDGFDQWGNETTRFIDAT